MSVFIMDSSSSNYVGELKKLSLGDNPQTNSISVDSSPQSSLNSSRDLIGIPLALGNILASVLDDAIDQLYILGAGMVPKTNVRVESIHKRAKEFVGGDPIFDPETGEPFEVAFNRKKLMKLYFDCSKLAELLSQIKIEMRYERDFTVLASFMEEISKSKVEEHDLFDEEKQNYGAMISLKQTLLCEQRDSQKHIHSLNEEIAVLKDQAEDVLFENLLRTRYIEDWEKARNEQNQLTCFQKENELECTINQYKNEIEKEIRVNTEIELYILENQRDMDEAIDQWVARYEKDSESRTVQIQVLKEKRDELEIEYNTLKAIFDLHQQQIDDYLIHKEQKRIEAERMAVLSAAAVKIQAWWRGLMVRLKLGPFNPKKKGKGKGKGKSKDKDKKKK